MEVGTIGLAQEQRSDFDMRKIFVEAHDLVVPFMSSEGTWISMSNEVLAHDAIGARFPDIQETRLFAVLATIAGVRASGRTPAG